VRGSGGLQFRDLRRSGMCWLRELRVPVAMIASISGHSIDETQKILDTYMPRDTRSAAEGMAIAVTRQAARDLADAAELEAAL
jgi:integrase